MSEEKYLTKDQIKTVTDSVKNLVEDLGASPDGIMPYTIKRQIAESLAPHNQYDRSDMVSRDGAMISGPLKFAVYRVRDPLTGEFSNPQYHITYDNNVMAVMPETIVQALITFYNMQQKEKESKK